MILNQISLVDCAAFVICLIPQLLWRAPFSLLLSTILRCLPFLIFVLPFQLVKERYFTRKELRSPFVQHATFFQDLVIRCVRFAFKTLNPGIGRIFFSKQVALPFFRFRMLRHGYGRSPIYWREVNNIGQSKDVNGLWIIANELERPDIAIYYCHGGGFSMGSSYFYLEFLIAWISVLQQNGYKNPAVFALEYTLVPEAVYPVQLNEMAKGFEWFYSRVGDSTRICLSGDSAGGTLCLSHLLEVHKGIRNDKGRPAFAILISPWTHIISSLNHDTPSDYLNTETLHLYGRQYTGSEREVEPVQKVSPGMLDDRKLWKQAAPRHGYGFVYGEQEVFAPGIHAVIQKVKEAGVKCEVIAEQAGIHAWPVVALFLGRNEQERLYGLQRMSSMLRTRIPKSCMKDCQCPLKHDRSLSFDLTLHSDTDWD